MNATRFVLDYLRCGAAPLESMCREAWEEQRLTLQVTNDGRCMVRFPAGEPVGHLVGEERQHEPLHGEPVCCLMHRQNL